MDMDLEKFFDRVNHDILMSRIARKVKDKRLLRIICRYLQAGMMQEGMVSQRVEGTPQGSLCSAEHNAPNVQCLLMLSDNPPRRKKSGFAAQRVSIIN